jgi:hypothetical protein
MLMSIWIGLAALATILLLADWYIWEPRYRMSDPFVPGPSNGVGKEDIQLRSAA